MLWKLHVGILNALEEWLLFSLIEFLSPLCIDGIAHQLEQLSAMHFSNTKDSKFIRLMDLFSPVYHKRKSQFASSSRWKITNNGEVDYPTHIVWVECTLHSISNFTRRKWLFPRRHWNTLLKETLSYGYWIPIACPILSVHKDDDKWSFSRPHN